MENRFVRCVLVAIAAGLWANAGLALMRPATAQGLDVGALATYVSSIYNGTCPNRKIC